MLDVFLQLQNPEGSFPRKFKDDLSIVDKSGGSTPSATLPLVMGYKYFKDKRYLESAKRTAEYLEKELISKSDYFSSTLDANCEDKEASLYAATATYYLALVSQGKEREHYTGLTKKQLILLCHGIICGMYLLRPDRCWEILGSRRADGAMYLWKTITSMCLSLNLLLY